jgi:hypothetical protein
LLELAGIAGREITNEALTERVRRDHHGDL